MIGVASTVKISFRALWVNKMRSFLTMLGIIIGVGAVIAMLAVGQGASQKISQQIASMGSNMLIVSSGAQTSGGLRMGMGTQMTLTLDDAEAIEKECPDVAAVAPSLNGVAQIVFGNQNWSTGVFGTSPGFLEVRDLAMLSGRGFMDQDIRSATKVAILGQTIVDNLFGDADPLSQIIRIKKVPFTVIGVLEPRGQNAFGQDQDDVVYIPVTTGQKKIFGTTFAGSVRSIAVKARSAESMERVEMQISDLLHQRHRIGPKGEPDFSVRNLTQMMQAAEESTKVMTLLLGAIASVSLLVGGIGIMNIMLVSVTERTREIGIRMAVGGKDPGYPVPISRRSPVPCHDGRHHRHPPGRGNLGDSFPLRRLDHYCFPRFPSSSPSVSPVSSESSSASIPPTKPPSSTPSTPCATSDFNSLIESLLFANTYPSFSFFFTGSFWAKPITMIIQESSTTVFVTLNKDFFKEDSLQNKLFWMCWKRPIHMSHVSNNLSYRHPPRLHLK